MNPSLSQGSIGCANSCSNGISFDGTITSCMPSLQVRELAQMLAMMGQTRTTATIARNYCIKFHTIQPASVYSILSILASFLFAFLI